MRPELEPEPATIHKIEVKVGSRPVIVEKGDLDNLIEALIQMRKLSADGRALMNIGSA